MNVLVTGGSGFIGTRLVADLLAAGHEVTIFDRIQSVRFARLCVQGDVRDGPALTAAAAGADAIIHLAAEHRDEATPADVRRAVNVGGTANVVAAARATDCRRIIFTSTAAVYPLNVRLATEETEPRPPSDYAATKLEAERVLQQWMEETPGAALVILRACAVFGEGNRGNVFELMRQIARGRFVMVGRGRNKKSLAYVGNLSRFMVETLRFPPGFHLLNYADKPDLTVAELVSGIRRALRGEEPAGSAARRVDWQARLRLPCALGLAGGLVFDAWSRFSGQNGVVSLSRIRKFCAETSLSTERLERTGFIRPYALKEALAQTVRFEFGPMARAKPDRTMK